MIQQVLEFIEHYRTDCYVLSFPKCGRTWFRFMLGNALVNHFKLSNVPTGDILMVRRLAKYSKQIPRIRFTHDDKPNWKHFDAIETGKSKYKSKKVIFLIRDPRDLVVSNYYQKKYRDFKEQKGLHKENFIGTISEFLRSEIGGLPSIIRFYNIWAHQKGIPKKFLVVRYEDLKLNPEGILREVFKFLDLEVPDPITLSKSIAASDFSTMRKIEEANSLGNRRLGNPISNSTESLKTRKGIVGGYQEELSSGDIKWMDLEIENKLSEEYQFYKSK